MTITIEISPLPDQSIELRGFHHFWLRYVRGFSPHFHCQKCLLGFNDPRFRRNMHIGLSLQLLEPTKYRHIYLCGIGPASQPGLHLALAPEPRTTARVETYNGIVIEVVGARKLEIPLLPDGYAGMTRKYTTCRNWQFGVQYYGLDRMRRELVHE